VSIVIMHGSAGASPSQWLVLKLNLAIGSLESGEFPLMKMIP
jgi:hypothetical protein